MSQPRDSAQLLDALADAAGRLARGEEPIQNAQRVRDLRAELLRRIDATNDHGGRLCVAEAALERLLESIDADPRPPHDAAAVTEARKALERSRL